MSVRVVRMRNGEDVIADVFEIAAKNEPEKAGFPYKPKSYIFQSAFYLQIRRVLWENYLIIKRPPLPI